MIEIFNVETPEDIEAARQLFREYEAWLGLDLCFQDFENELSSLPGKYAPPEGRLLLASRDDEILGGIALRKLAEGKCEMKRLFLRENARGLGIGRRLVEQIIAEARIIGYKKMLLDTFPPKMGKAVDIYRAHGFYEIPAYYENPFDDVLFMEKDL